MAKNKKGKSERRGATERGAPKFAGSVTVSRPEGGREAAVGNGSRVVVSLAELRLGRLPEGGARSEIQVDVAARTTAQNGNPVGNSWSSGVHYYVPHGARLNLADVVLFDGVVHQHLSLDFQIVERESPRMGPEGAAAVAESAAVAAAALVNASGSPAAALDVFPEVVGGILRLGGDDQVLRHALSWFTREVARPAERTGYLIEGAYRIEKRRLAGKGDPAVSLLLDVCRVG